MGSQSSVVVSEGTHQSRVGSGDSTLQGRTGLNSGAVAKRPPRRSSATPPMARRLKPPGRHQQIIVLLVLEHRSLGNLKQQLPRDKTGVRGPSIDLEAPKISSVLSVRTHPLDSTRQPKQTRRRAGVPRVRRHALISKCVRKKASDFRRVHLRRTRDDAELHTRTEGSRPQRQCLPSLHQRQPRAHSHRCRLHHHGRQHRHRHNGRRLGGHLRHPRPQVSQQGRTRLGVSRPSTSPRHRPRSRTAGQSARSRSHPAVLSRSALGTRSCRPRSAITMRAQTGGHRHLPRRRRRRAPRRAAPRMAQALHVALAATTETLRRIRVESHDVVIAQIVEKQRPARSANSSRTTSAGRGACEAEARASTPPHQPQDDQPQPPPPPESPQRPTVEHLARVKEMGAPPPANPPKGSRCVAPRSRSARTPCWRIPATSPSNASPWWKAGRTQPAWPPWLVQRAGEGKPLREGENEMAMVGGRRSRSGHRREGDADAGVAAAVAGTLLARERAFLPNSLRCI
ncbi:hypothetical protein BRADI_4g14581v3 [Brachypodium distachyon]|uniref:Uncharacterized protein n=1 Tax=Brachypodium distachyon TaxID=15368 RepID=A0A2K2CMV1_BRADI|nr:hypothetical protein BRADI_4g14581v3 [Brachypodium distachyon]